MRCPWGKIITVVLTVLRPSIFRFHLLPPSTGRWIAEDLQEAAPEFCSFGILYLLLPVLDNGVQGLQRGRACAVLQTHCLNGLPFLFKKVWQGFQSYFSMHHKAMFIVTCWRMKLFMSGKVLPFCCFY